MPTLQTSGAISLGDIQTVMGGSNPISLSEYYRGGGLTPSTRSTAVREPSSGSYYSGAYLWRVHYASAAQLYWAGAYIGAPTGTSWTTGGVTYFRGASRLTVSDYGTQFTEYEVYRTYTSTTNINGTVPTSGAISISQFYGTAKP